MTWLKELGKEILAKVISWLIITYTPLLLGFIFGPYISEILGIHVSSWNILLLLVLILSTVLILLRVAKIRQRIERESVKLVWAGKMRPQHIKKQIELEYFGVKWRALLGSLLLGDFVAGKYYVFMDGPFCPKCDYELDRKTKGRWMGLSVAHVWHCVPCNKDYRRPKEYLFEEREIVEKYVESRLRR